MSIKIMSKVWDIDLGNPIRKLVALKLADNANDHGTCWPSVENIAKHCNCSERSVKAHISDLKTMGILEVKRQFNQSNYYTISVSALDALLNNEAADAPYEAVDAPEQGQEIPKQGRQMPTNHKEPSIEPSYKHHINFEFDRFWNAGMTKQSKQKARQSFEKQFKNAMKASKSINIQSFTDYLIADINKRLAANVFGFDKMHPTTYLNQQRWHDDIVSNMATSKKGVNGNIGILESINFDSKGLLE